MLTLLLAQSTLPSVLPTDPKDLSSIGAVVLLTIFLVSGIRSYATGLLAKVPTWVYVALVASGLTLLANLAFKTLPGEIFPLLYRAIFSSLTAMGLHGMATSIGKPTVAAILLGVGLVFMSTGCTTIPRQELIKLREGIDAADQPIHQQYLKWAHEKLDAGRISPLGMQSCQDLVDSHNRIVTKSRLRDADPNTPPSTPALPSLPLPAPIPGPTSQPRTP